MGQRGDTPMGGFLPHQNGNIRLSRQYGNIRLSRNADLLFGAGWKERAVAKTPRGSGCRRETGEDLLRLYLEDISRHPLLTKEGEVRLARRIEAGTAARAELESGDDVSPARQRELTELVRDGKGAMQQFVDANLRLVVSIAKKYHATGLTLLDLIQEGNLGLMHAVEKFEWRRGFKFSTYATWGIARPSTAVSPTPGGRSASPSKPANG